MSDHHPVDNPQYLWWRKRQDWVADALFSLRTGFVNAQTALGEGAWKGTAGQAWEQEFTGRVTHVTSTARAIKDDVDDEVATKPAMICACQVIKPVSAPISDDLAPYPQIKPRCER